MVKKSDAGRKYSASDLKKIRERASEIWRRKRQSLNTALDDWLQAERELKATTGIRDKRSGQYTNEDVARIRERAQTIREEKVRSLHTAFDDWIEAEQEFKEELKKKIDPRDLFGIWFQRSSSRVDELLKREVPVQAGTFNDVLEQQYVELMAECMT